MNGLVTALLHFRSSWLHVAEQDDGGNQLASSSVTKYPIGYLLLDDDDPDKKKLKRFCNLLLLSEDEERRKTKKMKRKLGKEEEENKRYLMALDLDTQHIKQHSIVVFMEFIHQFDLL